MRRGKPFDSTWWILGGACVLLAAFCLAMFLFADARRKDYTREEFDRLVKGKAEAEIISLLGEPVMADREPQNSPQAGKRGIGYIFEETRSPQQWSVRGPEGAVCIFFNEKTGRADHIMYIAKPERKEGGGFIFIRW